MIEKIKSPTNVVAMRFSGKLSGENAKACQSMLDEAVKQEGKLGLLVDFTGLSDISEEGFVAGAQADLDFLSHIGRFGRLAFVSDKEWPAVMLGMAGGLITSPQMKSFSSQQLEAAVKWCAQPADSAQASAAAASMSLIRTDKPDVMGFEINGNIGEADVANMMAGLKPFLDRGGRLRMLARIKHLGGFDPSLLMQGGLMSMKFAALEELERYAIVGAPGWMAKAVETMNPLIPQVDMRHFAATQEAEAWAWLGAKPVK